MWYLTLTSSDESIFYSYEFKTYRLKIVNSAFETRKSLTLCIPTDLSFSFDSINLG